MDTWNPIIEVDPQVEQAVKELEDEIKSECRPAGGCKKRLADGQWWKFCGETDMGQTLPALCTECGGEYKLKDEPEIQYYADLPEMLKEQAS